MAVSVSELRDRELERICREVFAEHKELGRIRLALRVKGQIAHLSGIVPSARFRRLARDVAAGIRGISAVWDVLDTAQRRCTAIDIGCGEKKQCARSIGVDIRRWKGVDVVADISGGLPFGDSSIDYVFAVHCLEHIRDLLQAMGEIHRVLSPGGAAHIMVPAHGSTNAVADPTHVRFFNRQTFKYFCSFRPGVPLFRPIAVSVTQDNILADLSPVKRGEKPPSAGELALFFD